MSENLRPTAPEDDLLPGWNASHPIWAVYRCAICGKLGDRRDVLPGEHLEWHRQRGEVPSTLTDQPDR